jgi:hypothetical protein
MKSWLLPTAWMLLKKPIAKNPSSSYWMSCYLNWTDWKSPWREPEMKYFPLFADLEKAHVLVVGGGEQAAQKVRLLSKTSAHITVVAETVTEELRELEDENAIGHADRGPLRRHKAPDLSEHGEQRRLADVRALAGHVGAGNQKDHGAVGGQFYVVRHEGASGGDRIDDRMAAGDDLESCVFGDLRAAIIVRAGEIRQRREDIQLRERQRRRA